MPRTRVRGIFIIFQYRETWLFPMPYGRCAAAYADALRGIRPYNTRRTDALRDFHGRSGLRRICQGRRESCLAPLPAPHRQCLDSYVNYSCRSGSPLPPAAAIRHFSHHQSALLRSAVFRPPQSALPTDHLRTFLPFYAFSRQLVRFS